MTYRLEYEAIGQPSFVSEQYRHTHDFTNESELQMAIGQIPKGTKGRWTDGVNWHYFTAGHAGNIITSLGLPREPISAY